MKNEALSRGEQARAYFLEGYNCAQAVALAFADHVDMDKDALAALASSFGGGMGRLREVCGAVTGMFLILGLTEGYAGPETGEIKAAHYAKVQALAKRFEEKKGTYICRDLLGLTEQRQDPTPEQRTSEYYQVRPCPDLVALAAEILEDYFRENEERERQK